MMWAGLAASGKVLWKSNFFRAAVYKHPWRPREKMGWRWELGWGGIEGLS